LNLDGRIVLTNSGELVLPELTYYQQFGSNGASLKFVVSMLVDNDSLNSKPLLNVNSTKEWWSSYGHRMGGVDYLCDVSCVSKRRRKLLIGKGYSSDNAGDGPGRKGGNKKIVVVKVKKQVKPKRQQQQQRKTVFVTPKVKPTRPQRPLRQLQANLGVGAASDYMNKVRSPFDPRYWNAIIPCGDNEGVFLLS